MAGLQGKITIRFAIAQRVPMTSIRKAGYARRDVSWSAAGEWRETPASQVARNGLDDQNPIQHFSRCPITFILHLYLYDVRGELAHSVGLFRLPSRHERA